jgi:hypothetical protein
LNIKWLPFAIRAILKKTRLNCEMQASLMRAGSVLLAAAPGCPPGSNPAE